jgi:hypothetical protein
MILLPRTTLHSDSEQVLQNNPVRFKETGTGDYKSLKDK